MSSHHDERESGKSVVPVKREGEDNSSSRGVRLYLVRGKKVIRWEREEGTATAAGGGLRGLDLATNDHDFPHTEVRVAMRPHEMEAPPIRGRGVGRGGG